MRYKFVLPLTVLAGLLFWFLAQSYWGADVNFFSLNQIDGTKILSEADSVQLQIKLGQKIYESKCAVCHMTNGKGVKDVFPPLAGNDFLNKKDVKAILIHSVKYGKSGLITVNGVDYNGVMPALGLSDSEVADVMTYVYSSWGNNKTIVTEADVTAVVKAKVSEKKSSDAP